MKGPSNHFMTISMNRIALVLLFSMPLVSLMGEPQLSADPAAVKARSELRVRRSVMTLLEQGKTAEALAHLQKSLPAGDDEAKAMAAARGMIRVSYTFYNQKNLVMARAAATEAIRLAEPILTQARDSEHTAALANSLGVIAENIFFDLPAAQQFYEIAVAANAADPVGKRRLGEVKERIETRSRLLKR